MAVTPGPTASAGGPAVVGSAVVGPAALGISAAPAASGAVEPSSNIWLAGSGAGLRRRLRPDVLACQRKATGRVLDLRGPLASGFAYRQSLDDGPDDGPGRVTALVVAPAAAPEAAPFDTVCSFGAMAAAPDLSALLADVLAVLAPDGRLLFVEPDGDARRLRRSLAAPAGRLWGMAMARDISGALWSSGFEMADIARRPLRMAGLPLVRVVVGAARPATEGQKL